MTNGHPRTGQSTKTSPGIVVLPGDRWLGIGTSGSGKTTLAKHLIASLRTLWPEQPVYVLDSKGEPKDFQNWRGIVEQATPPKPLRDPRGVQVWRPLRDDLAAYDAWLDGIRETRQRAIVLIDELANICDRNGDAVQAYTTLQKQARGLEITVMTWHQEWAGIERSSKGQATHFLRMALKTDYDKRAANKFMGRAADALEPAHKWGFWYQNLDQRPYTPFYYSSWKAFLG